MKKEFQQLKKSIYCSSAFKKLSGSAEFTAQQSVKLKLPGRNALEICDVDSIFHHVKLKELISKKYILGKSITITSVEQNFSIMNNQLHVNNSSSWHQIKCCLRLTSMRAQLLFIRIQRLREHCIGLIETRKRAMSFENS